MEKENTGAKPVGKKSKVQAVELEQGQEQISENDLSGNGHNASKAARSVSEELTFNLFTNYGKRSETVSENGTASPEFVEAAIKPFGWSVMWEISGVAVSVEQVKADMNQIGYKENVVKITQETALKRAVERWVKQLVKKGLLPNTARRGYSGLDVEENLVTRLEKRRTEKEAWYTVLLVTWDANQAEIKTDTGFRVALDKKNNLVYATRQKSGVLGDPNDPKNQVVDRAQSEVLRQYYEFYQHHYLGVDLGVLLGKICMEHFRAFKGRRTGGIYIILDKYRNRLVELKRVVETNWLVTASDENDTNYVRSFQGTYSYLIVAPLLDIMGARSAYAKAAANEMARVMVDLLGTAEKMVEEHRSGNRKRQTSSKTIDARLDEYDEVASQLEEYAAVFGEAFEIDRLKNTLTDVRNMVEKYVEDNLYLFGEGRLES
jgi:hypothetical protein